jgi:hypothetical protein
MFKKQGGRTMKITRKEKKELFKKLTPVVRARLTYLKNNELTYTEMTERTGLTLSRISEIVNNRKDVNEVFLIKLLIGGIVNSKDLLSVSGINAAQEDYVKGMTIYEDADLRDEINRLKFLGEDPASILKDYREDKYGSKM